MPRPGSSTLTRRPTSKAPPLIERRRTSQPKAGWTFLSNHFHVLIAVSSDPSRSLREVALLVGVTERSAQRIVADLESDGYLQKERVGRNNHYVIARQMPLRHELEEGCSVSELLEFIKARNRKLKGA
jgi:DNA-binding MarR family transcriptional regulator